MFTISILFSHVTLTSPCGEAQFLVRKIPADVNDLFNYTAFQDYASKLKKGIEVNVNTDSYLYGGGDSFAATIEEVAYMKIRLGKDPSFLSKHCRKISESSFSFHFPVSEIRSDEHNPIILF